MHDNIFRHELCLFIYLFPNELSFGGGGDNQCGLQQGGRPREGSVWLDNLCEWPGSCGVSILVQTENPTRHSPRQSAPEDLP